MGKNILLASGAILMSASLGAMALGSQGTATISATLEIINPYIVNTTPLQFGEHVLPKQGSETISVKPGAAGSSTVTIEGSDGEATASLANNGSFTLTGEKSGDQLEAEAFFTGNSPTDTIDLKDGKAVALIGGETKLTPAAAPDDYTGTITVSVIKAI